MFLGAQGSIVFVVGAREALVVVAQCELVFVIYLDVHLAQKHILLAPYLICIELWQQNRESARGCGAQTRHIENLGDVRTLPIVGKKEEGLVPLDRAAESSAELVDPQRRTLIRQRVGEVTSLVGFGY